MEKKWQMGDIVFFSNPHMSNLLCPALYGYQSGKNNVIYPYTMESESESCTIPVLEEFTVKKAHQLIKENWMDLEYVQLMMMAFEALQQHGYSSCFICGNGGKCLLCDGCPNLVHSVCALVDETGDEDAMFFCQDCQKSKMVDVFIDIEKLRRKQQNDKREVKTYSDSMFVESCDGCSDYVVPWNEKRVFVTEKQHSKKVLDSNDKFWDYETAFHQIVPDAQQLIDSNVLQAHDVNAAIAVSMLKTARTASLPLAATSRKRTRESTMVGKRRKQGERTKRKRK